MMLTLSLITLKNGISLYQKMLDLGRINRFIIFWQKMIKLPMKHMCLSKIY